MDTSNPMVKQISLVKHNWQQNQTELHDLRKGTGKELGSVDSDETDIRGGG